MTFLYGRKYTRQEIQDRVGDISQIARVKPYRLIEGLEEGVHALDVTTGGGLDFTILASRGMDISSASYNGRSLAWRSATSDTHPAYFDHEGENGRGWLRSFYGGLVVTCGMTWAGANDREKGQQYGLHGRVSNLPASHVSHHEGWFIDSDGEERYKLTVTGRVREATVFGENLQLTRTITTYLGAKHFDIEDTVENLGVKTTPHMMLYHINIGFPAVNDTARLIAPTVNARPRDEIAVEGKDRFSKMEPPKAGFEEQVYFHELARMKGDTVTTAILDPECESGNGKGFGVYCTYDLKELPYFIEWKMMDAGTYVCGMEPANCLVMGRVYERERGALQMLKPGEKRHYHLTIGALAGAEECVQLETACRKAVEDSSQDSLKENQRGPQLS